MKRSTCESRGRILAQLAISTLKDGSHSDDEKRIQDQPKKLKHETHIRKKYDLPEDVSRPNHDVQKTEFEVQKIDTSLSTSIDDCNRSNNDNSLLLNESAIIEIDDPELRQLIESEDFVLDDYVVLPNNKESISRPTSHSNKNESIFDQNSSNSVAKFQDEAEVDLSVNTNDSVPSNVPPLDVPNETHFENVLDIDLNDEVTDMNIVLETQPNQQATENEQDNTYTGRPKKGRKRKFEDQTREIKKRKVNTNQEYITSKGNVRFSKDFRDYMCNCRLKCNNKVTTEEREAIFKNFYKAGSYEARCLLMQSMVKEIPIKRKRNKESERKTTTREYFLSNEKVCKNIFMQTLRVSSCSINVALSKKKLGSVEDGRGKAGGHNKLSDSKTEEIINHISKFPRYVSHYCRSVSKSEYLTPETTIPLMYKLYCEEHESPVSMALYKEIFYNKFNLKRKPLKKDTCNVCDRLANEKKNPTSLTLQQKAEEEHKTHLQAAEYARKMMNDQFLKAKIDEETECISFDLEKTLPLPRIPTNIVFYKRQLWFYNCGIHDSKNRGFCYTWVEGSAGRGAQEVGSCLRKHILQHVPEGTKHLLLWSDSCGGQNRNIKMTLLLKAVLEEHTTLEDITQHFLVPGHSFLRNDSDFSDIESCLKLQQRLYVPADYIEVIKTCRKKNKLHVTSMDKEDFKSSEKLEKAITNRKKSISGDQVNWLRFKIIHLKKSEPDTIFAKSDLEQDVYVEINISKQAKRNLAQKKQPEKEIRPTEKFFSSKLANLWPQGKPISKEKLQDLKSMFHLVPKDCQNFYKGLWSSEDVVDDIEGFSGALDFDIECDN